MNTVVADSSITANEYQTSTDTLSEYEQGINEILTPLNISAIALRDHGEDEQAAELLECRSKLQDILCLSYLSLGLAGEAGEVADKIKKVIRDGGGVLGGETGPYVSELGDVQFYIARLAKQFGHTLNGVMRGNLGKLFDRQRRGVISGSGDNR